MAEDNIGGKNSNENNINTNTEKTSNSGTNRRDFLFLATGAFAAGGAACAMWPPIAQMFPDDSVLALASIEKDISSLEEGQEIKFIWRGVPVFIRHRTAEEIAKARDVDLGDLVDNNSRNKNEGREDLDASDKNRVKKPEYIVMLGKCTHLGCVPVKEKGDYDGWYCPCHGSHYDTSGRIRKGPAPQNLEVPKYEFISDTVIKIG